MSTQCSVQEKSEKGFIVVEGDLDSTEAGEALRQAFEQLFSSGQRTIILDLSKVAVINSYSIGKILMWYKRLHKENGALMIRPLQGFVKETFELLELHTIFPTFEDE